MASSVICKLSLIVLAVVNVNAVSVYAGISECGRRPVVDILVGRVVGGRDAFDGQVPWQALVKESHLYGLLEFRKCGAVLISDKWAITAAHCSNGWFGSLVITLGVNDVRRLGDNDENTTTIIERQVKRIMIHPKFDRLRLDNDIALVELQSPVSFNSNIQPICLPNANDDFTGRNAYISGWGHTKYSKIALSVIVFFQSKFSICIPNVCLVDFFSYTQSFMFNLFSL